MPPRNRIYSDALQDDADLNAVLQAFQGIRINHAIPAVRPAATPLSPSSPSRLTDSSSKTPSSPPALKPKSESDDEDVYWNALRGDDDEGFWALAYEAADQAGDDERDYVVAVGRETGPVHSWHRAGHASQGIPGGTVRRVTIHPPRRRGPRNVAWVVYEGLIPGIYSSWTVAEVQVTRVSGGVHQGFSSRAEAERAYLVAYALGCVRALPSPESPVLPPPAAAPTPLPILQAFSEVSDNFLGAEWHVVFKGKRPGVYPAWNFVASQTKGVSHAIYNKYSSRLAAQAAFDKALRNGETEVLE